MSMRKGDGKRDLVATAMSTGEVSKYLSKAEIENLYDKHKGVYYSTFIKLCESIAFVRKYEGHDVRKTIII